MYWIMMSERSNEYELSIDGIPSILDTMDLNFDYGNLITQPIPTIDIPYTQHPEEYKTDNIVAPTRLGLIINRKVKRAFDSLNISNIQYFKSRLVKDQTGELDLNYCIANIIGKFACVDKAQSELDFFDDGEIEFIDKLTLNLDKNTDYGHIFRLAEFPPVLIISDDLKNKLEEDEIGGLKIYRPEDFSL